MIEAYPGGCLHILWLYRRNIRIASSNPDIDSHFFCPGRRDGNDRSFKGVPFHFQLNTISWSVSHSLNYIADSSKIPCYFKIHPTRWNDRFNIQPVICWADPPNPLGDCDIVPGSRAGKP